MVNVRCQCGKIVCQQDAHVIVIKCRHCKRSFHISSKQARMGVGQIDDPKSLLIKPSVVNI